MPEEPQMHYHPESENGAGRKTKTGITQRPGGAGMKQPLNENDKDWKNPAFNKIYGALAMAGFYSCAQDEVTVWLNNNGFCKLTVCPVCHVDDFVHVEGCEIGKAIHIISATLETQRAKLKKFVNAATDFA